MINKSYVIDPINNTSKKELYKPKQDIYKYVQKFLEEIKSLIITLPLIDPFNPVERLKLIPRTGKAIRIEAMDLNGIKARSIYDHIISMAYLGDSFLVLDKNKLIKECDYANLGRLIAYHEIGESLIGDIPAYTEIEGNSPKTKNYNRIKNILHDKRARIVNEFLWMYANDQQRASIDELNRNISHQNTPLMKYFKMLDRIDPVITIWRYLYHYRRELQIDPVTFVNGMNDFFVYPKTLDYKNEDHEEDFPYLKDIFEVLMNSEAAIKYCTGTKLETLIVSKLKAKLLKYLIEDVPLFIK